MDYIEDVKTKKIHIFKLINLYIHLFQGVDINKRDKKGHTVMDLLSANPSQRSREITAWIYSMYSIIYIYIYIYIYTHICVYIYPQAM